MEKGSTIRRILSKKYVIGFLVLGILVVMSIIARQRLSHENPVQTASGEHSLGTQLIPVTSDDVPRLAKEPGAKLTLVNVWATWCGPCQEEMPELVKFQKTYESKGVRVVLISANEASEEQEAIQFLSQVKADFPSYILAVSPGAFVQGLQPDWNGGLPATFLLDPQGRIKKYWIGQSTFEELVARVDPFLAP